VPVRGVGGWDDLLGDRSPELREKHAQDMGSFLGRVLRAKIPKEKEREEKDQRRKAGTRTNVQAKNDRF